MAANEQSRVFVDPAIEKDRSAMAGLLPNSETIILDPPKGGGVRIGETLEGRTNISSPCIVSHGDSASVRLGVLHLSQANLACDASRLPQWSSALTDKTGTLFEGCNRAAGKTWATFVRQLALLTGTDVAASNDFTGSEKKGDGSDLELAPGDIEVRSLFQSAIANAYRGVFALPTPPADNINVSSAIDSRHRHTQFA